MNPVSDDTHGVTKRSSPYSQMVDREHPVLFVFLIDQSDSMAESIGDGGLSKAVSVSAQLNTLIYELIMRCVKIPNERPRPYFFAQAFGYSTDDLGSPRVNPILTSSPTGWVSMADLAVNPLRIDQMRDPNTGVIVSAPVWVDPVAGGGTPMCRALDVAGSLASAWLAEHRYSFPPIVINITDGEATDGDPLVWSQRLRSLESEDGHLLLFNIALSAHDAPPQLFPGSTDMLADEFAALLMRMSSQLPESTVLNARSQGIMVETGSRGFAYNADMSALAMFMNIGTSIGRL